MTTAPANLLAVRAQLLAHLPLSGTAVGIVGDTAHVASGDSYHLGRPEQALTGYASTESPRDKAGLCEYASALDEGWWQVTVGGRTHNLRTHSVWMVQQCQAGAPDTKDIREIIYSPDGKVVKRWDRLGRRTSGDTSHLSHTHRSYFRDATKAGRDLTALDRRYLTEIGLIQEDDMFEPTDRKTLQAVDQRLREFLTLSDSIPNDLSGQPFPLPAAVAIKALRDRAAVDPHAVATEVLAVLSPAAIAAAIPTELARQVADELHARLAS